MELTLEPDLSHCIETVAKAQYERVLAILLRADDVDRSLEKELELLRLFLESADFGTLRSRCDDFLLAGKRVRVHLTSTEGVPEYDIETEA